MSEERSQEQISAGWRWSITIVALAGIALRLTFPTWFERLDFVSVALAVVALIPWISPFISKISIPGVIEAELKDLRRQVEHTEQKADTASDLALRSQELAVRVGTDVIADKAVRYGSPDGLLNLSKKYVAVRKSMPSGPQRTVEMDEIFGRMLKEAATVGPDWEEHLKTLRGDPGEQLGAIAYAYVFPASTELTALIDTVEVATQPFIQYWGLKTIQRALELGSEFSLKDVDRLQAIQSALSPRTDRYLVADSISRTLKDRRRLSS